MKVYIGWSGERSRLVGKIFNEMLPYFIHTCRPFFSPEMGKGLQWLSEITDELRESAVGIFCLTKENLNAPWLLFEAGALSKGLPENHVCTFLLNLESSEITEPLSQFQDTKNTKEELFRLINTVNSYAKDPVSEQVISKNFEKWWPEFEEKLASIPPYEEITGKDLPPPRDRDEILEEMLGILRGMKRERTDHLLRATIIVEPRLQEHIVRELMQHVELPINSIIHYPSVKGEVTAILWEWLTSDNLRTIMKIEGVRSIRYEDPTLHINVTP